MIKGDKPFDMAAVHKIFATFEDAAAKMPALFPERAGQTGAKFGGAASRASDRTSGTSQMPASRG